MTKLPEHSPLGGSGAYRWMPCPGSVSYARGIKDDGAEEYREEGIAAHAVAEACLRTGVEAWQLIGHYVFSGPEHTTLYGPEDPMVKGMHMGTSQVSVVEVDKEMADAVQVYLNAIHDAYPNRSQCTTWIEYRFHCPKIHKLFYGMADFARVETHKTKFSNGDNELEHILHVWDYKHGAGIMIEVQNNPQLMYYACGVLESLDLWDEVDLVVLHIAQPRGFHFDGPLREWSVYPKALWLWMQDTLKPAMDRAMVSLDTASGEHCRFCPVNSHQCPQILDDFDELEAIMREIDRNVKGGAAELTNEQTGRFLNLLDVVKIAGKGALKTAFARMSKGTTIPGRKLVKARSNRDWIEEARAELKKRFGKRCMTEPELKSPAKIDELPGGADATALLAFKPDKGLTVARDDDTRPQITKSLQKMFKKGKK